MRKSNLPRKHTRENKKKKKEKEGGPPTYRTTKEKVHSQKEKSQNTLTGKKWVQRRNSKQWKNQKTRPK